MEYEVFKDDHITYYIFIIFIFRRIRELEQFNHGLEDKVVSLD
jgi:hypothetical protein